MGGWLSRSWIDLSPPLFFFQPLPNGIQIVSKNALLFHLSRHPLVLALGLAPAHSFSDSSLDQPSLAVVLTTVGNCRELVGIGTREAGYAYELAEGMETTTDPWGAGASGELSGGMRGRCMGGGIDVRCCENSNNE